MIGQLSGPIRANRFSLRKKKKKLSFLKTQFARIWPSASKTGIFLRIDLREPIRANLRNVGVRIACPLSWPILADFGRFYPRLAEIRRD